MIKFEALAMDAEANNMHTIFLLKKNIKIDIIKIIFGCPLMAALETLREWKMAIALVK